MTYSRYATPFHICTTIWKKILIASPPPAAHPRGWFKQGEIYWCTEDTQKKIRK